MSHFRRLGLSTVSLGSLAFALVAGPALAQATIKIGEINSYKALPQNLVPYRQGWLLAQEEVNAAGGVLGKKLETVFRDDNANPGDAVRMAEELLARENVDLLSGVTLSAIPTGLSNAAQLVIGISLGVRFTPDFLHTAPRWLASVALATVAMMALCAAFAWGLSWLTGLHPATMVLASAPGGIAEMSITAKVLQLGVPVVTAFQVCRLVAVLMLAEPLYRWWARRQA